MASDTIVLQTLLHWLVKQPLVLHRNNGHLFVSTLILVQSICMYTCMQTSPTHFGHAHYLEVCRAKSYLPWNSCCCRTWYRLYYALLYTQCTSHISVFNVGPESLPDSVHWACNAQCTDHECNAPFAIQEIWRKPIPVQQLLRIIVGMNFGAELNDFTVSKKADEQHYKLYIIYIYIYI